jgi:type IV secretion system protein VirD4
MYRHSRPAPAAADGLLLGWERPPQPPFGFGSSGDGPHATDQPVHYPGDNHLLAVAPTGTGKGRSFLLPLLLTYPGPVIVIDVKGEAYHVTARRRREMGHAVYALDPFHQVSERSACLNPVDLCKLPGSSLECDAEMLASTLAVGHEFATDRYWNDTATPLIAGLLAHTATTAEPAERNLNTLRKHLYHDDMDYQLAVWLDTKIVTSQMARDEFVSYLSAPADKTRPCIRSTACTYVKALGSRDVADCLARSSFDLNDVIEGKPLSIYLVIPPEKLESHKVLLRLWVATLLTAICRRRHVPRQRTLFLLDEAAQLGSLPALRQAVTLLRGYGLQMFTFWQDLSQLKLLYPQDWETILNNSGALALFGLTPLMMQKWAEVLGVEPAELRRLSADEAFLSTSAGYRTVRRLDYLRDPLFTGLHDPNPRFSLQPPVRAVGAEAGER